jgi:hypothetical protein
MHAIVVRVLESKIAHVSLVLRCPISLIDRWCGYAYAGDVSDLQQLPNASNGDEGGVLPCFVSCVSSCNRFSYNA